MLITTATRLAALNTIELEAAFARNGELGMKIEAIHEVNVREHDVIYTVDFASDPSFNEDSERFGIKVYVKQTPLYMIIAEV